MNRVVRTGGIATGPDCHVVCAATLALCLGTVPALQGCGDGETSTTNAGHTCDGAICNPPADGGTDVIASE